MQTTFLRPQIIQSRWLKKHIKVKFMTKKNKTFVSFAFVKRKISMVIARLTKEKLSSSLLELY